MKYFSFIFKTCVQCLLNIFLPVCNIFNIKGPQNLQSHVKAFPSFHIVGFEHLASTKIVFLVRWHWNGRKSLASGYDWIISLISWLSLVTWYDCLKYIYLFLCGVRIVDFVKRKHFLLLVVVSGNNVAVCGELETTAGPVITPGTTEHADVSSQLL